MAIHGNGREYDIPFLAGTTLKTTTTQYLIVAMVPATTTADRTVELAGIAGIGSATQTAFKALGINQSFLSAGSDQCSVRLFGVSKAVCAQSISAGEYVMPYWGVSTTTMSGRIVAVDDGVSCSAATMSVTSQVTILGRALESGSTGTVISVFVNPQLYDLNLVGSISIT